MVNPVTGDKPLSPATERSGESRGNNRTQQSPAQAGAMGQQADRIPAESTVTVDEARQLYNMENEINRTGNITVDTPEAARSLLERIVEQFSSNPEQAYRSQTDNTSVPLTNLLQKAPA